MKGYNLVGFEESRQGTATLKAFSTVTKTTLAEEFAIATKEEINRAIDKAGKAFEKYSRTSAVERALFLETIADEIMAVGDELIERAKLESGLPEARLQGERGRTTGQLRLFAAVLREGSWVEAVIDTAMPERTPLPRADIRKMLVPVGPVLVFGASNFPFAFSTAGGDTASALAAGNPVIVKAHEAHLGTNELMANAISRAAQKCNMPDGVFSFVISNDVETIQQMVKHETIKAIGFTGSRKAGNAIFRTAAVDRKKPIPVYAEMSSINPVLVLPGKLNNNVAAIAAQLVSSVTLGAGQFCTNPGLIFVLQNADAVQLVNAIAELLLKTVPATMLNKEVCSNYYNSLHTLQRQQGVQVIAAVDNAGADYKGAAALLQVGAADFIVNEALQEEVFGPSTLVVVCKDQVELQQAIASLHGQLTGTVIGTHEDISTFQPVISALSDKVGRLLYNGVPTGVEVCHAMVHGGPYPATTNANSTSVGADAIKRFARPLCLQDCPQEFLPDALKDENPLKIIRKVNGEYQCVN